MPARADPHRIDMPALVGTASLVSDYADRALVRRALCGQDRAQSRTTVTTGTIYCHPHVFLMCEKCEQLYKKIEHYQKLLLGELINPQLTASSH
jgi:hypothetical protein